MRTTRRPHRTSRARQGLAAAVVALGVAGIAGVAGAQDVPDAYVGGSTTVAPTSVAPQAQVLDSSIGATEVAAESLAFTGGDALLVAAVGGGLVVVGAGAVALRRRQFTAA